MTQLQGLSRLHPSQNAMKACCSFAITNSNFMKRNSPFCPCCPPDPLVQDCKLIESREAHFASLSHKVLLTPLKSNPRRHFCDSNGPPPLFSFLVEIGSFVLSSVGIFCFFLSGWEYIGMMPEMKMATYTSRTYHRSFCACTSLSLAMLVPAQPSNL